jgi:hypothetical protein
MLCLRISGWPTWNNGNLTQWKKLKQDPTCCTKISCIFNQNFATQLNLMFFLKFIVVYQYRKTNVMHFLYSIYYKLKASKCFEHYLLIFRRRYTNNTWYIARVLIGVELVFHSNPGAANTHKTHAIIAYLWFYCTGNRISHTSEYKKQLRILNSFLHK